MQLLLDFMPVTPPPTLQNFVVGKNAQLLNHLHDLMDLAQRTETLPASARCVYIWGESGSGRSHLLQAFDGALYTHKTTSKNIIWQDGQFVYAIDDVEKLSGKRQQSLFTLINEVRSNPKAVLMMSGSCAPMYLKVRDDLKSRLSWGLVYQLHSLSDDEKQAALTLIAHERGLQLANDILPWLMTHWRRDMTSLMALMEALDRYTLSRKKATITLPLLKDWLNESSTI